MRGHFKQRQPPCKYCLLHLASPAAPQKAGVNISGICSISPDTASERRSDQFIGSKSAFSASVNAVNWWWCQSGFVSSELWKAALEEKSERWDTDVRPQIPQNRQYTWTCCHPRGVPRCCAVKNKSSYLSNSDSAITEAESSAHSKQRWDLLVPPSWMSTTDGFCVSLCLRSAYISILFPGASIHGESAVWGGIQAQLQQRRRASWSVRPQWCVSERLKEEEEGGETGGCFDSVNQHESEGKMAARLWAMDAGRRRWHQHEHHRQPCDDAMQRADDDDDALRALDNKYL